MTQDDTQDTVPEADDMPVAEEAETADTALSAGTGGDDAATVLINLETLIKSHITGIDKRKSDLKKYREMLSSALTNDETYRLHEQKAKEAAKLKSQTKSEILKQPENAQLAEKVKDAAAEIKEMDAALSDYLREYERMSGSNEIEGEDGEVREIVYVAKLVKRPSRKR